MSQATDYVLANQSGANFRAELNTILAAAVSQNSGATAPTTTYAYQWWIDTGVSPALLKLRNGANSAWITIGDVTAANLGLVSTSGATFTGNITLNAQSDVRFADSDSSNWVALQAPATVTSNVTWTLPATDGTSGQSLTTDAAGTLSWASRAALGTAQTFTAAQRGTITALTDGATITPDFSASNNYSVTLGGSRTLANPTNAVAGQSGVILITQDGTGNRTLSYGTNFVFPGGDPPTLTTTASAIDALVYFCDSSTRITARLISDIKRN
jgi:hypothetical protein